MPAGGYFSNAGDVAKLCQMMLNGGLANGKRSWLEFRKAVEQKYSRRPAAAGH
jgi:CubicO group peptidase (beta-lactamase class C family)